MIKGLSKAFEYKTVCHLTDHLYRGSFKKKKKKAFRASLHSPQAPSILCMSATFIPSELSWTIEITGVLFFSRLDFSSVDLAGLCLPSAEIKSMHHHNMATNLYILLSTPKKFWQHDRCPCLIKLPSNEDEEATR